MFILLIAFAAITSVLYSGANAATTSGDGTLPHVVFILADDLGYGDVHALNAKSKIPTPHLDRLAADGMTFTDAHTPSSVCTPTRYGVLTGRYCWRSPLKRGVLNGYSPPLIETERPTVASLLHRRGYHCGIVGKWHLGLGWVKNDDDAIDFSKRVTHGPNHLGFDYSYIIPASLDFPPYVYLENGRTTDAATVSQPAQKFPAFLRRGPRSSDLVMEDCLDRLTAKAVDFIRQCADGAKPFFLYFPLTAPHKPVLPHSRFRGKTRLGPYGDFVAQVDWSVGKIVEALHASGCAENTLVIFTSDNGSFMHRRDSADAPDHVADETIQAYRSQHHTANYLYRGTKADIWEAGHHVPFIAKWPGEISGGSKCASTICLTDFFATAADIAKAKTPKGAAEDSFSFASLLRGESPAAPRAAVIHHSAAGMFAIRQGKWKLVLGNSSGGREAPRGMPFQRPYQLFDLSRDVSETKNVIAEFREVARRLEIECGKLRNDNRR